MRLAILVPALVLVACGTSTPPAVPAEAARLRPVAQSLVAAVEAYQDRIASMASPAECRTTRSAYEARVGPAIEGLLALAPRLDAWMRERGAPEHADLACEGASILAEFERHTDIACTAVAMEANRAEASRHLRAMEPWVKLVAARVGEAEDPADGAAHRTGPRCVRFADGGRMYMP
ncbi:MAG: hypothetical protein WB493_06890 [Anaeromyxobacteraceae bacterium]